MSNGKVLSTALLGLLAVSGLALAQDPDQGGPRPWRPATEQDQAQADPQYQSQQQQGMPPQGYPQGSQQGMPPQGSQQGPGYYPPPQQDGRYAPPPRGNQGGYQDDGYQRNGYPPQQQGAYRDDRRVPAHLTVKPGTYLTIRTTQFLSSDRNHQGDAFSASLEQPLIVDGVVVAQRGQTVGGRITEAQKAGRVEGTSRLGVELIDVTLADGSVVPIQSQMVSRDGRTSVGRDVGAVAGTTALGAIIGAGADRGRGAAIGAGAGAAAGILGVLLTRGEPTVIRPESVLTFRVQGAVEIATDRAPQAFHYADDYDYQRQPAMRGPGGQGGPAYGAYGPAYPAYGYPGYYPYYGSGFSVFVGPGYYGRYRGYSRFRR
jgi:hypothetical protein